MKLKGKRVEKPKIYMGTKFKKRPMEERLDDYIEFTHNTKNYSDAGFFEEVKDYIADLKEQVKKLEDYLSDLEE
jgi:hypothetical protein